MTEQENKELMYASDEDKSFYNNSVKDLPTLSGLNGTGKDKFGLPLPYGTGPHSVRCLREISEIVKPKIIAEIGLNMGWSAAMWLELNPKASITSCDISYKDETIEAAKVLKERYGNRFDYFNILDGYKFKNKTDLIFIDGSHELNDVIKDIEVALSFNIPYISFDDVMPDFGFVQDAINLYLDKLVLIKVMGNIALYKNKNYNSK
jgi:hypothetical protein